MKNFKNMLDSHDSIFFSHGRGREIGVGASAIPVSGNRLRVKSDHDAEVFCNTVQQISGNPHIISHLHALAGANLELPLSGHHLQARSLT